MHQASHNYKKHKANTQKTKLTKELALPTISIPPRKHYKYSSATLQLSLILHRQVPE